MSPPLKNQLTYYWTDPNTHETDFEQIEFGSACTSSLI
jgi:hypothetical protein